MRSNSVCQRSMSPLKNPEARVTVSQRSRFITPKAIRKISDRTEGALTRRTRHRGIKTAKKLIKGPVWEQCRSLPRIYPSLWRTSTGTVQMPAGVAPTDSPALNFLSSALATAAVLNLGDAKPDLHRQFDDLGAGGGGQGGLQFHSQLPKPARRRAGSASKPCVRVSTSHGSSMTWRWSCAPLVTCRFSVVAVTMEKL